MIELYPRSPHASVPKASRIRVVTYKKGRLTARTARYRTLTQGRDRISVCKYSTRANERERELTRGDDGHVHEDVQPDLPVEQRLPDMAHLEVLLLPDRRVVVLWVSHNDGLRQKRKTTRI